MEIAKARIQRVSERDGEKMAEIHLEVINPHSEESREKPLRLVAYVKKNGDSYEMPLLYLNRAEEAVDWYDNTLHQSFAELEPGSFLADAVGKRKLLERILQDDIFRADLEYRMLQ